MDTCNLLLSRAMNIRSLFLHIFALGKGFVGILQSDDCANSHRVQRIHLKLSIYFMMMQMRFAHRCIFFQSVKNPILRNKRIDRETVT